MISQVDGNRKWKQDKHVGQPWSWLKPENAAWNTQCKHQFSFTKYILTLNYNHQQADNKGNEILHIYPPIQEIQTELDAKLAATKALKSIQAPKIYKKNRT